MSTTLEPQVSKTELPIEAVEAGRSQPLGAIVDDEGVNFSVFAENATAVELLLFEEHDDIHPATVIPLDPRVNRSFHFWHVYIRGLKPGTHYAYRVDGPQDLHFRGYRFDVGKVLLDPYARGITDALWDPVPACRPGDNLETSMRGVVVDTRGYGWEGDQPLNRPINETIIYELHVGGFTRSPTSGVANPGTFAGVIEKIPYLQELGVTAVELLPIFEFDDRETLRLSPSDGTPLRNYWGYDPILHFAPQNSYCVEPESGRHVDEFRDLVKALHWGGIEVILDVVFNHTGEGNHLGPTISLKGFGNDAFYMLAPQDRQYYLDYSGCGNTVNANHPIVEKLIIDSLHYWVEELHVDGFRFDEASILHRGSDGSTMTWPPAVWRIELSERLANTKIIAEAWDAGGLYEIGSFPGERWSEWNGRFRDDARRFVRGDPGVVAKAASRIAGSADIYEESARFPTNSINFVTAHDGFTLNDLVSYNEKHNEANGEGNRDGIDENLSWNCGAEGETANRHVQKLRRQQIKNFCAILMLSQGVPMFVAGDEVRRTQGGNNNAYCQDNELTWFDWGLVDENADVLRFFQRMIAFRKEHRALQRRNFFTGEIGPRGLPDVAWHGQDLGPPSWSDPEGRVLAFTIAGIESDPDIHVMMNMDEQQRAFALPSIEDRAWRVFADTSLPSPRDVAEPGRERALRGDTYPVEGRSIVILVSADRRRSRRTSS